MRYDEMFDDVEYYKINRKERNFGTLLFASILYDDDFKNGFFGLVNEKSINKLSSLGGFETAKLLIRKEPTTSGFTKLWENNRLDLSVESYVIKAKYDSIFSREEKEACRNRLSEYGYNLVESESADGWNGA